MTQWILSPTRASSPLIVVALAPCSWYKAGLTFDGEYDTSDVGRTPNAAPAPPLESLRNVKK